MRRTGVRSRRVGEPTASVVKRAYVTSVHGTRAALARTPALDFLDGWAGRSRRALWLRSLLAIHDLPDLAALDVPWWTFEASDAVASFLARREHARVFEWGSGASTLWLGRRAGQVISVEHDPRWAQAISALAPQNVRVGVQQPRRLNPGEMGVASDKRGYQGLDFLDYVDEIDRHPGLFDLIVIDGRVRHACLLRAVGRLAPDGLILVDNVERKRNQRAVEQLERPAAVRWTTGLTPCLPYPTATALIRLVAR